MKSNCYLVYQPKTFHAFIIDPGDDDEYIIGKISQLNLKPKLILMTHGHFDHLMAAYALQTHYKIPVRLHKNDTFLVQQMSSSAKHFLGFDPGPPPVLDQNYLKTETLKLAGITFDIIESPGHTPGSICLYSQKNHCLFSGDLIFTRGGLGRYDFSYSDKNQLLSSVQRILKLPLETIVYPGHGDSFSLKKEKDLLTMGLQFNVLNFDNGTDG